MDFAECDVEYLLPIGNPEKLICVGVNFPDRNEEYKDGQAAPPNPSLFIRFPRSFTGHGRPLIRPPESPQLDCEGEIVTGTPTGAGARFDPPIWLKPGDVVEIEAQGLGILRNTIEDEV